MVLYDTNCISKNEIPNSKDKTCTSQLNILISFLTILPLGYSQ